MDWVVQLLISKEFYFLIVTANIPLNLKHLTEDRLKLLTLFLIYKDIKNFDLENFILIPIYIEIKVSISKYF